MSPGDLPVGHQIVRVERFAKPIAVVRTMMGIASLYQSYALFAGARTRKSRLIDVALLCPLCPGSDQIPHRAETTRCARNGS